jgi:hypothetical protein
MAAAAVYEKLRSLAICQKLQTNFLKLKIVEKKRETRKEIFLKQHKSFQIKKEEKKY